MKRLQYLVYPAVVMLSLAASLAASLSAGVAPLMMAAAL